MYKNKKVTKKYKKITIKTGMYIPIMAKKTKIQERQINHLFEMHMYRYIHADTTIGSKGDFVDNIYTC
jgi:hypothetical protein